jgi:hypothetical protein
MSLLSKDSEFRTLAENPDGVSRFDHLKAPQNRAFAAA